MWWQWRHAVLLPPGSPTPDPAPAAPTRMLPPAPLSCLRRLRRRRRRHVGRAADRQGREVGCAEQRIDFAQTQFRPVVCDVPRQSSLPAQPEP